jgi:cobalt/nickel transport system ATP-binding protein
MAGEKDTGGNETVFTCEEVFYAYLGRYPALIDVSLRIDQGESVGILGANGSGKSTLLLILDALLFAASGRVTAFGQELRPELLGDEAFRARFRKDVAMVFQNPDTQLFCPTVRDEVAFGPLQLDMSRVEVEERVGEIMERLRIAPLAERAPFNLSGGEKKKVAIASALAVHPRVLLLDEPTATLDPRSVRELVGMVADFHREGGTLVVATHDLHSVPELVDRIYVFDETHRIVASGPTEEILSDETLLERCNLIHLHSHRHQGRWHLHPHGHTKSEDHH